MYSPAQMDFLLLLYSLLFRLATRIKDRLYRAGVFRPSRAPFPVISVGNISLGGTEKTPLAMELLRILLARGRRPALISRGYRGRWEKTGGIVSDGRGIQATWRDAGDEPFLVARTLPQAGVFVGKDRLASCRKAAAAGFDIAVLDDGFQHLKLGRDLDIVLFSPTEKTALREPLSALRRAHVLLLKEGNRRDRRIANILRSLPGEVFKYEVVSRGFPELWSQEEISAESLSGKRVLAFCGIARPERFLASLRSQGLELASAIFFPDHHAYPPSSFRKIRRRFAETRSDALITTEKDAVKIGNARNAFGEAPVYVFRIGLALEPGFFDRVARYLTQTEKK
ncbi:MAG: tetraacyldisaccharide 4'-kinase [Acidobacteriota bacterium]